MKLLVLSDLHVEVAPFVDPVPEADVVVLAGDIHNGVDAVRWARERFADRPVVQVPGNHEFYEREYHDCLREMRAAAAGSNVHFLENDACVINGVRFLGCTLWTDFRIFDGTGRGVNLRLEAALEAGARGNPDFRLIRIGTGQHPFTPRDAIALHQASRKWLADALSMPFDGPTVVVTHHLPSWRSVNPAFARYPSNAAFVSDVDDLLERADCWIHGHTHASCHYRAGSAVLRCNPRGYPVTCADGGDAGFENQAFDPGCCVELPVADRGRR